MIERACGGWLSDDDIYVTRLAVHLVVDIRAARESHSEMVFRLTTHEASRKNVAEEVDKSIPDCIVTCNDDGFTLRADKWVHRSRMKINRIVMTTGAVDLAGSVEGRKWNHESVS
jgi:NAD kinase